MPTVTSLLLQKKRPRVNVMLDGEYAFSLTLDLAASLRRGQVLDDAAIAALKRSDSYQVALAKAMNHLTGRPRSATEIERYLRGKEVETDVVADVLRRLGELQLVDDAAFARWWAENRSEHRPKGKQALKSELFAKGVRGEAVDAAIQNVDEPALAIEVALSQARRLAGQPQDAFVRRLSGFLQRRGFGYEDVRRAVTMAWERVGAAAAPEGEGESEDEGEV